MYQNVPTNATIACFLQHQHNGKFVLVFFVLPYSACDQFKKGKITVSWIGATGTLIEKTYIDKGEDLIERELPSDTDEWHYTSWKIVESSDVIICVAQRVKKVQYICVIFAL